LGCNVRHSSSSEEEKSAGTNTTSANRSSGNEHSTDVPNNVFSLTDSVRYAVGYRATEHDGYTQVEVRDPWNEGKLLQRYLLVPRNKALPEGMPNGTIVRVPLRHIVVYTSVHCAVLDALGATGDIVGVCESRYIKVPAVKERIVKGLITDLGEATSPNVERMIEIGTEVVLASPFDHGSYGPVEKLGIPIIECADYMETDPLGRAEWIKFIGLLTGRMSSAESLFRETEENYLRVKALVENVAYRPKLMTGKKFGSPWYVPSGESFMACIYKDAGADYLFSYLPGTGGTPMSFETVLDKAIHADVWLIHYNWEEDMTYSALKADYSSYSRFDAFHNHRIYGCNTNYSLYYEEVPLRPDYLLAELIAIFHPDLMPEYVLRYFSPLKE
jgi:iron complex transport system substrate-binding protein